MIWALLGTFLVGYALALTLSVGLDRLTFWASVAVHCLGLTCSLGVMACGLLIAGAI